MPENPFVPPVMETSRLQLRPIAATDAEGLHALYGDPEAMRYWDMLPSQDASVTAERIAYSLRVSPEWHAMWSVLLKDGGHYIGMVNYHNRMPLNRRLAIGWILGRPYWKRGFMQEAVQPVLDYCFDVLATHRVEALIEPGNTASIRLAERLGFRWEGGLMRHRLLVGDTWRDVRMYALLEDEWHAANRKT
jgi:ribosomal-protein-alanine N-acetyltransferase